jgi:predicted dehydrogenase
MSIRIGICGIGQFAPSFVPLFQAHPEVSEVRLAELVPDRRENVAKRFGIRTTYDSFEPLLASDVDAVAIFTQRWMHAKMAIQALRAGKHVYCAVPAAVTLEELGELVDTVKRTGLTYMLAETSYYYPAPLYCRERFREGAFGRFVYGEGEYYHDMSHGFYEAYQFSGGPEWKRTAGYPPMLYPTHSVSMVLSVTGARVTHVSCLGQVDQHEDGIFRVGQNNWDNAFSNQTALMRTSDGGMMRVNEFRRVGMDGRSVRLSLYGTEASFEEQFNAAGMVTRSHEMTTLTDALKTVPLPVEDWESGPKHLEGVNEQLKRDFSGGWSLAHERERKRLPKEFASLPNGHEGSHQFLCDDFVKAVVTGKHSPNHVWQAARYNAPGIVAYESAKREGEMMHVPDFGWPNP